MPASSSLASTGTRWRRALGHPVWQPELVYHLRGTPDASIGVDVRARGTEPRLLAGLREHRSQAHLLLPVSGVTEAEFLRSVAHETHVVAWPQRGAGLRLDDVFAGLDD